MAAGGEDSQIAEFGDILLHTHMQEEELPNFTIVCI